MRADEELLIQATRLGSATAAASEGALVQVRARSSELLVRYISAIDV